MRKILSLVLVVVLLASTGIVAFAEEVDTQVKVKFEIPQEIKDKKNEIKEITKANIELRKQIVPTKAKRIHGLVNDLLSSGDIVSGSETEQKLMKMKEKFDTNINEYKEQFPDEFEILEGNRERLKEVKEELKALKGTKDYDAIERLLDEILEIKYENNECLNSIIEGLE